MDTLRQTWEYVLDPKNNFLGAVGVHLQLSLLALMIGAAVGLPLGVMVSRSAVMARVAVNGAGVVRVVPSLALLFLLIPLLHTGFAPSLTALAVLAVPPLLINTEAGMRGIDPAVVEAARGMGMTRTQLLRRVQLPLALPVILAGVRIAAVEVIASATLAALIGGGGLGEYIASGLSLGRNYILLAGAIPVALMSLGAEIGLGWLQRVALRRGHIAG